MEKNTENATNTEFTMVFVRRFISTRGMRSLGFRAFEVLIFLLLASRASGQVAAGEGKGVYGLRV